MAPLIFIKYVFFILPSCQRRMDKPDRLFRVNPWSGGWPWQYLEGRVSLIVGVAGGGDQAWVVDIIDRLPNQNNQHLSQVSKAVL